MGKSLHRRLMDIARAQDDVTHLNEKGVKYFSECLQAIRVRDARIAAVEHDVKTLVEAARTLARSAALSDRELDVVRQEWGNTNVKVLRHWRDRTLDALAALGTPATPEADDGR